MTKLSHQQAPLALNTNDVATKRYVEDLRRVTASGDYLRASLSTEQLDPVLNDAVLWDTVESQNGAGISLNTGNGQLTLRAGRTYYLRAELFLKHSAAFLQQWAWYDVTNGIEVPASRQTNRSTTASANWSSTTASTAIVTPASDTVYEVRLVDVTTAGVDVGASDTTEGLATKLEVFEVGSTVVNALGGVEFMDVIEVTANTQTVSFGSGGDGLYGAAMDGDVDETYLIEYFLPGGVVANFEIRPNGLTTNMFSARNFGGSAAGNNTYSTLSISDHFSVDRHSSGKIELYAKTGRQRMYTATSALAVNAPGNRHTDHYAGTWTDTGTNITSLDIHATVAGAITTGSYFALWRRRTGNAVRADSADSYERRVEAAVDPGTATEEYTTGHTIYAGSIVGLTARLEEAVTAGTVTVNLKADGVTVLTTVLDTTNATSNRSVVPLGSKTVGANKNISVEIAAAGYDNAGSLNSGITVVATLTNEAFVVPAVPPYMPGHIDGLEMSFSSATTYNVAAGSCRDSTNTFNIDVLSPLSVDISTSGAGGLDQGTEAANTWYALLVIADSLSINSPDLLLVAAANFPGSIVMPAGYDVYRRVGWVRNDAGSSLKEVRHVSGPGRSRTYGYIVADSVALGTNLSVSQVVDASSAAPPTATRIYGLISFSTGFAANGVTFYRGTAATDPAVYRRRADAAGSFIDDTYDIPVLPNQTFYYREEGSDVLLDVSCEGFTDEV